MKKLYALIIIVTVMLNLFQHLHAQKWEKTQPDILYAQDKDKGLNVKIGIGTDQPTAMLDVFKRTHLRGNVTADSSLSAFSIIAQQAQFATAVVTGQITAGSLTVSGNATINGQLSSSSLSVSGNSTLNNATINQQLTTSNITSSTGSIDFSNNNLTTTGNVNSTNISAIQTSVGSQQSQIANLNTQVSAIHSSQWTTNPIDSSISFNGNVFVKNLGVSDVISIGDFRFSNGGAVPQPIIRDSIRTPNQLVLASGAEKIMFDADSVMMGNTARVGNGQLSVAGNITASGDISSGTVTSGSIVTSQLIIDTLHALSRVAVNHSLMIEKQTAKSYAEVSTTDTAVALVLQKDSAGKGVGIGITPSAGERLSVAGNVGVSGNLRLSNLSGTGDRVLAVDSNGVLKDFPNSCFGLNAFWKTDGNIVPANCNPFIGTTNTFALNFRTANLPRMTITSAGNVGIGTSTPGNNMQLEVQGSVSIYDGNGNTSLFFGREQPTIQAMTATNQYGEWGIQYWQNHGTGNPAVPGGLNFWKPSGSDGSSAGNGGGNNFLFLSDNGQVQIGDKTPDPANSIHTDYKLSVDGKVVARKLVATEVNWADDELTKHLTLDSLQQDEKFVLMFGYLSGIPSGKEVETNGVDFGQMSSLQMRKIERLYKYSFKFNHAIKKIDANILQIKSENVSLKNENEELKKQFNEMKKQIADLQNKMNVLLQSK